MNIRKANIEDFYTNWHGGEIAGKQFVEYIKNKTAELWIAEDNFEVIGEVYFFTALSDNDFANENKRAYITNFSVHPNYRGQGIGTQLLEAVFTRLRRNRYIEATIGVEESEIQNIKLYNKLGFINTVKKCNSDPICVDENGKPFIMNEFLLLMKSI